MKKIDEFMNHASQKSVLIKMKDGSINEIIRDYYGDEFSAYDSMEDFANTVFSTANPYEDLEDMYSLDNEHLALVKEKYPDAIALYWGEL